jgi:hypothetical protein
LHRYTPGFSVISNQAKWVDGTFMDVVGLYKLNAADP